MRLEFQITILMLLSMIALAFHHFVPRTEVVKYASNDWDFLESHGGPGTHAETKVTERGAETVINVAGQGEHPFVAALFQRGAESPIDFGWFSQVKLKAYVVGKEQEYFRLFLRNRIPELYAGGVPESRQYNEVAFELSNEPRTLVFKRKRFHVPSWWVEGFATQVEHATPQFDCVDAIEINTGSSVRETQVTLVVESIELSGQWVSSIVLYRVLLSSWLILGLGVMIRQSLELRSTVRQSLERESRLKLINSSLESERVELARMALNDSLTGLLNRHGLKSDPRIEDGAWKLHSPASLVVFDIDFFKKINDTRGHSFGDRVLADVGDILKTVVGQNQLSARWGGEEFVVVCFEQHETSACEFAEMLRSVIEDKIGITCSFGVHEIADEVKFSEALDCADRAMYEAKSSGRNRVVRFSQLLSGGFNADENPAKFANSQS